LSRRSIVSRGWCTVDGHGSIHNYVVLFLVSFEASVGLPLVLTVTHTVFCARGRASVVATRAKVKRKDAVYILLTGRRPGLKERRKSGKESFNADAKRNANLGNLFDYILPSSPLSPGQTTVSSSCWLLHFY
jgi:hypothetical protein